MVWELGKQRQGEEWVLCEMTDYKFIVAAPETRLSDSPSITTIISIMHYLNKSAYPE